MERIDFRPIYLPENRGLGNALRVALQNAKYELVARMDSDDISSPQRFEMQLDYFSNNCQVDVVGGQISEFVGNENNIIGQRIVYERNEDIRNDMKKRCAMNHVSVMYKKSSVQQAGGYMDWPWNEDYYLWVRMMQAGCQFANVQDNIVNVRTGEEMSSRRGGRMYFNSEKGIQKYMFDNAMISFPRYAFNVVLRFGGEILLSNKTRSALYKLMRKPMKQSLKEKNNMKSLHSNPQRAPFSVAISVYKNDNPEWFDRALKSITVDQTVKPHEIVLVIDGPIDKRIQDVISKYEVLCSGS